MADQFYFDEQMQDLLLACVCNHAPAFSVVGSLVLPEYFWGVSATKACAAIQDFKAERGDYPTLRALKGYLKELYGRDKADLYEEAEKYITKLQGINTRNFKWVRDTTVQFCRERALIVAIRKSADLVKAGKVPEGGFAPWFDQAIRVGTDINDLGLLLADDIDAIVDRLTTVGYGVKTGYQKLDDNWYNGWCPGWLVVPIAPPKSYKSTFCINLALNMVKGGGNREPVPIFYYACEIAGDLTAARAYCVVSGTSMGEMYKNPQTFKDITKKRFQRYYSNQDGSAGNMLIKTFPAKTASIADIRTHVLAASDFYQAKPRVIVIDHAETVRPGKRSKDYSDWRSQADIYTEARALAAETESVVIMPDRVNKEAAHRAVPDKTSFQGAFEKAGIVDVAIGLCQTPEERIGNIIRYIVCVNRHGKEWGYYQGKVADDHFTMSVDEVLNYEQEMQKAAERQKRITGERGGFGQRKKGDAALPKSRQDVDT